MHFRHGSTLILGRFLYLRDLGSGVSSQVFLAFDQETKTRVALKFIVAELRAAGDFELELYTTIAACDIHHQVPIATLLLSFEYGGHLCLVLELLGDSIMSVKSFPPPRNSLRKLSQHEPHCELNEIRKIVRSLI